MWLQCRGIDPKLFSAELTASYDAVSAVLLPGYRRRQLTCRFDFENGFVKIDKRADYAPMGQRGFFFIASRLLLQQLLVAHSVLLPVLITPGYLGCLDTDWSFAVWRLILSASGPVLVSLDQSTALRDEVARNLVREDWDFQKHLVRFEACANAGEIDLIAPVLECEETIKVATDSFQIPEFLKKYPD